jgi:hypothetical protein
MRATFPKILLSSLLGLFSACATRAPEPLNLDADAMEKSIVVTLASSDSYPAARITADRNPREGTALDFDMRAYPNANFTAYVYLVGGDDKLTEMAILRDLDQSFLAELDATKEHGIYSEINGLEKPSEAFKVDIHGAKRTGLKRAFSTVRNGNVQSFTYLFHREPFAVKYRASFYLGEQKLGQNLQAERANEAIVDALVSASLPNLKVTWPEGCRLLKASGYGNNIYLDPELNEQDSAKELIRQLTHVQIVRAKNGCEDLEEMLLLQRVAEQKLQQLNKKEAK